MTASLTHIQAQLEVITNIPHLDTPDIVGVLLRCEDVIDGIHYEYVLFSMNHAFFDAAEQLSERLASSADRFDYPTGGEFLGVVSLFQIALEKFLLWRRGIRISWGIRDCTHETTVFLQTKHLVIREQANPTELR